MAACCENCYGHWPCMGEARWGFGGRVPSQVPGANDLNAFAIKAVY